MHQSLRSRIMDFMRSMPHAGSQRTSSHAAHASSLNDSTEQNHCGVARKMIGFLQRQQCGYEWTISSEANSTPASFMSFKMTGLESSTIMPAYLPA